jgi:peptidoglycan biosynthesis protein MviN/MurJ (putative lipid II flippase)
MHQSFITMAHSSMVCRFFLACRAPRIPMTTTAAAGLINLCGDILLCKVFSLGALGAAIATSSAHLTTLQPLFITTPAHTQVAIKMFSLKICVCCQKPGVQQCKCKCGMHLRELKLLSIAIKQPKTQMTSACCNRVWDAVDESRKCCGVCGVVPDECS